MDIDEKIDKFLFAFGTSFMKCRDQDDNVRVMMRGAERMKQIVIESLPDMNDLDDGEDCECVACECDRTRNIIIKKIRKTWKKKGE